MIIGNGKGTRDVAIRSQTTPLIDLRLTKTIDTAILLAQPDIDDVSLSIQVVTTPVVGNLIILKDADGDALYQSGIFEVTPTGGDDYTIGVNTPLDFSFSVSDNCFLATDEMSVNGSVTPEIFELSAFGLDPSVKWDILRVLGSVLDGNAMGDNLFGGQPELTKGVVIRTDNGITKNIFTFKTNGELREHSFNVVYADKPPAGQHGMSFRRTFGTQGANGVALEIKAVNTDGFKVIIQDDLSSLIRFRMVAQGHVAKPR